MSTLSNSPRLVKGGIVILDPNTAVLQSAIALQYNPDSLTRTLQIQAMQGAQDGTRVDALRLRGPAVETIKLDAELDATDQLEFPSQFPLAVQYGLQPQLAQLRTLVNPTVERLRADWAPPHRMPVMKLGRIPLEAGAARTGKLGGQLAGAITRGLKP